MTSSSYIRLIQPLTSELDGLEVDLVRIDDSENLRGLDAVLVSRTAFNSPGQAEKFLEKAESKRLPIVVDVDDAFHLMDETHPQYKEYLPKLESLNLLMDSANEIWCSTAPLQESLHDRHGISILVPNSIDSRLWRTYRDSVNQPKRDDRKYFELLYAGSITHGSDLEMVIPALDELNKSVPIRLTVIGIAPDLPSRPWIRQLSPGKESLYPRFAQWLRHLAPSFDVGIAPLTDKSFNQYKSDLKILEYLAMGLVPVASACQPYVDSPAIENSLLCSDAQDWLNRLASLGLMSDEYEEQRLSVVARNQYLWNERSAVATGNRIANRICELLKD